MVRFWPSVDFLASSRTSPFGRPPPTPCRGRCWTRTGSSSTGEPRDVATTLRGGADDVTASLGSRLPYTAESSTVPGAPPSPRPPDGWKHQSRPRSRGKCSCEGTTGTVRGWSIAPPMGPSPIAMPTGHPDIVAYPSRRSGCELVARVKPRPWGPFASRSRWEGPTPANVNREGIGHVRELRMRHPRRQAR